MEIAECATLAEAVTLAHDRARPGDVVTLSPACASFDAYPNFMAKGQDYKRMVAEL